MASGCALTATDSLAEYVKRIDGVLGSIASTLAISLAVVAVTLLVLWGVGRLAWSSVASWRKHTQAHRTVNADVAASDKFKEDDVVYTGGAGAGAGDGVDVSLPEPEQRKAIEASVARLGAKYAAYNRAIATHAANRGEAPDSLMDAKVLSAAHDDYSYAKRADAVDDALVYRKKEGGEEGDTGTVAQRARDLAAAVLKVNF